MIGEKEPQQAKKEPRESSKLQEALRMKPAQLVNFFIKLEKKGELMDFLESAIENREVKAHLSYWEKWFNKEQRRLVEEIIARKKQIYPGEKDELPLEMEERFSSDDLPSIINHIGAIQLTYGCSKGCPFCGFDAVPGVREHIPYSQLANLCKKYGEILGKKERLLYWASEPSDYKSKEGLEDKTYQDVHQLFVEYAGFSPHITTNEIQDPDWLKFLGSKVDNGRVSLYGLSEEEINNFSSKKIDIKIIGKDSKHERGIGKSFEATSVGKRGISCFNGVLLTPRGLYNIIKVPIRKEFPQGQIVVPIEKISGEEIKVGDDINHVLSNAIVPLDRMYHDKSREIMIKGYRAFLPYVTIIQNQKAYDVIFDEDYKVRNFLPSIRDKMIELGRPYLRARDLLELIHKEPFGEYLISKKELIQELLDKINKKIDTIKDNKSLYNEILKVKNDSYKKIMGLLADQLNLLGGKGAFDMRWSSESIKNIFGLLVSFRVAKDTKTNAFFLQGTAFGNIPLHHILIPINCIIKSEPNINIGDFWKEGQQVTFSSVSDLFEEMGLNFKIEMNIEEKTVQDF